MHECLGTSGDDVAADEPFVVNPAYAGLPKQLQTVLGACDLTFPYLTEVQEIHDLIVILDLQKSDHPKIRQFLTMYPCRPETPAELNTMTAVHNTAFTTVLTPGRGEVTKAGNAKRI